MIPNELINYMSNQRERFITNRKSFQEKYDSKRWVLVTHSRDFTETKVRFIKRHDLGKIKRSDGLIMDYPYMRSYMIRLTCLGGLVDYASSLHKCVESAYQIRWENEQWYDNPVHIKFQKPAPSHQKYLEN